MRGRVHLLLALVCVFAVPAGAQPYHEIFNATKAVGRFGDAPATLYLAPSPYISDGLVEFIRGATSTLDVCVFEVNLPKVMDALLDARERKVAVRVAVPPSARPTEYEAELYEQFRSLERRKMLRYTQNKSGLMHNKFMVADGLRIWTGSYNFTRNDTEYNDNNALTFASPELAANYTAEFEEIWAGVHGKRNATPTPHPVVHMGATTIRNLFAPEDDLEGAIVEEVLKATNNVYMMAFAFTDVAIFNALSNRVVNGVKVYTLFEQSLARQRSSRLKDLREIGATVRISPNNGQMHHKVIVVDDNVVITGSANFSASALKVNDENLLIFNSRDLARAMTREFTRCWQAQPYIWNKWSQKVR